MAEYLTESDIAQKGQDKKAFLGNSEWKPDFVIKLLHQISPQTNIKCFFCYAGIIAEKGGQMQAKSSLGFVSACYTMTCVAKPV